MESTNVYFEIRRHPLVFIFWTHSIEWTLQYIPSFAGISSTDASSTRHRIPRIHGGLMMRLAKTISRAVNGNNAFLINHKYN